MDIRDLHQHLDSRLDRIEGKLDDYSSRLTRAEEALVWMQGHLKIVTAVGIAVIGSVLASFWAKFIA